MSHDPNADLRPRVVALEARSSAIEARQARTENMLGELTIGQQSIDRTLKELVELIKGRASPSVVVSPDAEHTPPPKKNLHG